MIAASSVSFLCLRKLDADLIDIVGFGFADESTKYIRLIIGRMSSTTI
jgi:hypothetical protein